MLTVKRSGSGAAIARDMRDLVDRRAPLALAKTLTFVTQKAQRAIVDTMPKVFQGGASRYTLNSTRIEPATVDKLMARVAVKDRTTNGGIVPENFLFPSVRGGGRREKRFEKALRLEGLLQAGERALPGAAATLDAQGNFKVSELRKLLRAVRGNKRGDVFVGRPGGAKGERGIYRRKGRQSDGTKTVEPLLIFTTRQPRYSKRFDFEGLARDVAVREFEPTFRRLLR